MVTDDFADFVAAHGSRIARACTEIAGNDQVAQALRDDLLADVAARWPRWPAAARTERALSRIEVLLRREARAQHAAVHPSALDLRSPLPVRAVPWPSVPDDQPQLADADQPEAAARLAATARQRAARGRRMWRIGLAIAALAAVAVALLRPTPPAPEPRLPTEIPEGVVVLPDFDELMTGLTGWRTEFPPYLSLTPSDVDALPALADAPLFRATLVARADGSRLVVVGDQSPPAEHVRLSDPPQRRVVAHPALGGARLAAGSLSPDGTTVGLLAQDTLVLVDARNGDVRSVTVDGLHPAAALAWLDDTRILVTAAASHVVDVGTGVVRPAPVEAVDVLSLRLYAMPRLAQLVPTPPDETTSDGPHTIRSLLLLWRDRDAAGQLEPVAGAGQVGVRRIITGPTWLRDWVGPGFASPQLVIRACDPAALLLPREVGLASGAIAALDGNGNLIATLVAADGTRLDALGVILDEQHQALVAVRAEQRSMVVAWDPYAGTLRALTHLNADTQVSIADVEGRCDDCRRLVIMGDQEANAAIPVSASPTTS